ncbi:carbohydrate porin, partial [Candidatus Binatus sp.]|uniref:carbohydrate porin n=1 Tax=Candidatus Binatus sp. TaxID=2811406 RepID=UPI002FD9C32C
MSKLAAAIRRHFVAVPHISVAIIVATCFLGWGQAALAAGTDPTTDATSTAGPGAAAIPLTQPTLSATEKGPNGPDQIWNWHVQNTDIEQGDWGFPAKYSGPHSLKSKGEQQETVTLDLFAGVRLWRGAEAHVDGLAWQGFGLSKTLGIEDFPNGDAYKLGTETPYLMFARLFIRQTIGLGGEQEAVPDNALTLASNQDISRLTFTIGRFTPLDVFDHNTYAQDPHTQFMNWAMAGNLTWDYSADSIGYTTGIAVELNQPKWALRYGFFQMPRVQNYFTGDDQFLMWRPSGATGSAGADGPFLRAWGMVVEFERRYSVNAHPGAIRLMPFLNEADMASNHAATAILLAKGPAADISAAQAYRYKYGFGLNWEQEVGENVGLFSRLGWNDGHEQAWAYNDANWTASLGVSVKGDAWQRPGDTFGLVGVVSGASRSNQKFLEAGGLGILAGDGALTYGSEKVLET